MHNALSKASIAHLPRFSIDPPIYIRLPRGGAAATSAIDLLSDGRGASLDSLQDEDIDRMVEDLIAGVDNESDDEQSEEAEEVDDEAADLMDEGDLRASDLDDNDDGDVSEQEESAQESDGESVDAPESLHSLDGTVTEAQMADSSNRSSKEHSQESGNNPPAPINANVQSHPSTATRKSRSRQIKRDTTTIPTNAYYRFLVRGGPKGHLLASFSLLSIQWIHTYLPFLYKFAASILLTLRIYDPNLLHIKEREWLEREERRRNKVSFTDKLRGVTFSSSNGTKKKKQREDDQVATSKLQQLFKTAKTASLDWKEIRYSYLSADFRRRHGLGGEYVTKKPVKFMGESVGGEFTLENGQEEDEEVVFDETGLNLEQDVVVQGQMLDQTIKKQHKRKRKIITDWVVQSFANQHFASTITTDKSKAGSSNYMHSPATVPPSLTAIWKSVQKDAILNAAWQSRNAEKSIWANDNDNRDIHNSPSLGKRSSNTMHQSSTINVKPSNLSSGSASKMFQSVMTRVGSNGRLLGAYPMDALPLEECCHRKGVIELARRYGYGDWNVNEKNWEENGVEKEADYEMWGGGDLFFEKDVNEEVVDDVVSTLRHRSKSGKEKRRIDYDAEVSLKPNKSRSRRRRMKPQQQLL
ncbi:hypothetical protein ACHAWO_000181 [Cyclotella atomus]|uniref:Uncharacterized protein n=1 Tax=Cyclotella atomus TaxID=382360 RepID=A0ABD3QM55_9STRA